MSISLALVIGLIGFTSLFYSENTALGQDTFAPSISITAPQNGATVTTSDGTTITGVASDNVKVKRVEVKTSINGFIKAKPAAPGDWSTWSLPLTFTQPGIYNIAAMATDPSDNQKNGLYEDNSN